MKNSELRSENVEVIPDKSHYAQGSIEPWQFIVAHDLDFFEGSIVKYVTRWRYKNGVEDLRKVVVYCDELIRQMENGEGKPCGFLGKGSIPLDAYVEAHSMDVREAKIVQWITYFRWFRLTGPLWEAKREAESLIAEALKAPE